MNIAEYGQNYIAAITASLQAIKADELELFLEKIKSLSANNKRIFFIGNGGSALNAIHFSMGLSYISKKWNSPIRSFALCESPALLSSLSNDYSFEDAFAKQVKVHCDSGDLLVILSSSGKSQNLINAAKCAKDMGVETFALLGTDGGDLLNLCDSSILIKSELKDAGYAEDIHMVIGHIVTTFLEYHA